MGRRDKPAGSAPAQPDTPVLSATVRSFPAEPGLRLQSKSRLSAEVLPSCPALMLHPGQATICSATLGIPHNGSVSRNRCTSSFFLVSTEIAGSLVASAAA